MSASAELFQLSGVSYSYLGRHPAVRDVDLEITSGERVVILGANGCGKSTMLKIMDGLLRPESGRVVAFGEDITGAADDSAVARRLHRRVGLVFQDSDVQLFSPTVMDELLFGPLQLGVGEDEAADRAADVMRMLGIEGLKDRPSYMLSGGEKKRVAIGSVLTMSPGVLLLDEPTNGLDPKSQCFLIELIIKLGEAGKTVVVSTHDLSLVSEVATRVAVLSEEHKVEKAGGTDEILSDEDMLLKVNLIHEHMHSHGQTRHKHAHSHFTFHRH